MGLVMGLAACGGSWDGAVVGAHTEPAGPVPGVVAPALPADPAPDEVASQAPGAPELALQVQQTKTFAFGWQAVPGATSYRLLEDPSGSAGYTEVAQLDGSATAHDLSAFLPGRINARYILQACNAAGCSDSSSVSAGSAQVLSQAVGYVKASNTEEWDWFASALALSADGQTLAVGAACEASMAMGVDGDQSDNSAGCRGAVYVFVRESPSQSWRQQAYLKSSTAWTLEEFGLAVALSADGNVLAVGAPWDRTRANDGGAVTVFARTGAQWAQQARLVPSYMRSSYNVGSSVAVSGDGMRVAFGVPGDHGAQGGVNGDPSITSSASDFSGAVWVYAWSGHAWEPEAYLKAADPASTLGFGQVLAMSHQGDTLATVAGGNKAFIFVRDASGWREHHNWQVTNTPAHVQWMQAGVVAVSGDGQTVAFGVPRERSSAVGIGGNASATGADNSGAVFVLTRQGEAWTQQAYIKASNSHTNLRFGEALALSADGSRLAVGASRDSSGGAGLDADQTDTSMANAGAVYLFDRTGGQWAQSRYVKAPQPQASAGFGWPVALSGSGDTLAVGAGGESSAATGINGNQSDTTAPGAGAVFLY